MDDKLAKMIHDAGHAQRLLEDPLLKKSFDKLESEYMSALFDTMVAETDKRERLWQATHIVRKVREHLRNLISGGAIARAEIESISYLQTK